MELNTTEVLWGEVVLQANTDIQVGAVVKARF